MAWIHTTPEPEPEMEQYLNPSVWTGYAICLLHALTRGGPNKMAAILQTTYSDSFSCINIVIVRFKFEWNLFQVPIKMMHL